MIPLAIKLPWSLCRGHLKQESLVLNYLPDGGAYEATPAHQDALWHQRERNQDANQDCGMHLRAYRHCQKTLTFAKQPS